MKIHTSSPTGCRRPLAAFSLVEVMVAATVLAIGLGSVVAINSNVIGLLRRSTSASYASQLMQERMEQFRRAAWTEITSNYPPDDDDHGSVGYDEDSEDGGSLVDDDYPTEFPYDEADLDSLTAGLVSLMGVPTASAAQLRGVKETVRVETYNSSSSAWTGFDWNGDPLTLQPFTYGGRPIVVTRQNGTVTQVTHNAMCVYATTVRLTLTVEWAGTDGVQRTKETVTLFTVEGDK
jgi:type II secretory pathway pseudopilin PulG